MGDQSRLRSLLIQTDNTAISIQSSAASMMKMYDKSPALAVSEWRNALQSCRVSQLLPLLYVANEVLQTSKRNRGNRFLEEFSPVLKGSLVFICERDRGVVEKVRRTAKIWGDRRVFSVRFVSELLAALQSFRDGTTPSARDVSGRFSPLMEPKSVEDDNSVENDSSPTPDIRHQRRDDINNNDSNSDNGDNFNTVDDHVKDDDEDPFFTSGPSLLKVDNLRIDQKEVLKAAAAASTTQSRSQFGLKRRRSEESSRILSSALSGGKVTLNGSTSGISGKRRRSSLEKKSGRGDSSTSNLERSKIGGKTGRRRSVLSTSGLVELLDQMSNLDSQFDSVDGILSSMTASKLLPTSSNVIEDDVNTDDEKEIMEVGDELIDLNQQVVNAIQTVKRQKSTLHEIAEQKKIMEGAIQRYLPWLKTALKVDEDEMKFCEDLEKKLRLLQIVHADAKKAREKKRDKEAKEIALAEAAARKKAEEEELKRSLEETMKNTEEPKPGMVWNKQLREYQYLPDGTEESWRD